MSVSQIGKETKKDRRKTERVGEGRRSDNRQADAVLQIMKTELEILLEASIALVDARKAAREAAENECLRFPKAEQ